MKRFVEGEDRRQGVLLPEFLDDYVSEENPVRVIDVFVEELDLGALGFAGVVPEATGRPAYHPGVLLKIYVYGYINQIASSRRLEREAQRNVELMWLTGRLAPDFKTIADFRKDNGPAIRATCRRFIDLCRRLDLFSHAVAAIDGSKFKAVIGPAMRHDGPVLGALVMPNGDLLSWSDDKTLRQWDVKTGAQIGPAMRHDAKVIGALVMPDGHLVSWSNKTLRQWDANWPAGSIFAVACSLLPDVELHDVLERYHLGRSDPICRSPQDIPLPDWSKIERVSD